jgi:hypothetical protein
MPISTKSCVRTFSWRSKKSRARDG